MGTGSEPAITYSEKVATICYRQQAGVGVISRSRRTRHPKWRESMIRDAKYIFTLAMRRHAQNASRPETATHLPALVCLKTTTKAGRSTTPRNPCRNRCKPAPNPTNTFPAWNRHFHLATIELITSSLDRWIMAQYYAITRDTQGLIDGGRNIEHVATPTCRRP